MSQHLKQTTSGSAAPRDYGAMSSSSVNPIPDVSFSGFSPTEFMSLSEDIANNISAVNSSCKAISKCIPKFMGPPRDLSDVREKVHKIHAQNNTLIEATSKDLQRLTAVVRRGDKQQKLQLEKLTNDFRIVVEKYSAVQQRVTDAMKSNYRQMSNYEQNVSESAELVQRRLLERTQLQFEEDMLVERERQLRQIESDILDVNSIMRTISTLTQAQGEEVERIESSIEQTASDVEVGREELAKASERRQNYRRKILLLLVIAVIIGLFVAGIIVSKISS